MCIEKQKHGTVMGRDQRSTLDWIIKEELAEGVKCKLKTKYQREQAR